ncbi:MAG: aminotransferase class V-fold PLP-dependent enzyme [Planctomycetes bacterium]|nr:aminotransferase class V-fold PLP-dependent enzyme [Planctomycetota bacterium]
MAPDASTKPLAPPEALPGQLRAQWMLDGSVDFLNHGCFGARLRSVFAAQEAWRVRFEADPVQVLDREGSAMLAEVKLPVGAFLGMRPDDFGFVTNATDGVNAVLGSLRYEPGDELLTTSHVYNAVRLTMQHLARRVGLVYREVDVPLPVASDDEIVAAVAGAITDRTRILLLDHVASMTALRFPLERLIALGAERGVDVLVDGAHAPGMLSLDVERLGAPYYVGNLHKWLCAPPGAAFLWVRPDRQAEIHPNVISHYLGEGFGAEFSWQGTRDYSSWMTVPDAIAAMDALDGSGSWPRIMRHNHEMATWVQSHLAEAWDVTPLTPLDGSMLGSMAILPVPAPVRRLFDTAEALHDVLYDEHRIEVPVFEWQDRWMIRPSCQVYNAPDQYERLARVVRDLF